MMLRYFWDLKEIPLERVLLVESGSRQLIEDLIPALYRSMGNLPVDLVTCYGGAPSALPTSAHVYRIGDYATKAGRQLLVEELRLGNYSCVGILCSNEPIMTKWKWLIALRLPVKIFIVNENGDYFWFDRSNLAIIRHFALFRMGLTGAGAIRTIGRLLLFPFSVLYLLLYAFVAHAQRALRLAFQTKRA